MPVEIPSPRSSPNGAVGPSTSNVIRVDLPTPDGAVILDDGHITVIADPRIDDAQVARLQQAAQLLAELVPATIHGGGAR